jgi:hypothetical protein
MLVILLPSPTHMLTASGMCPGEIELICCDGDVTRQNLTLQYTKKYLLVRRGLMVQIPRCQYHPERHRASLRNVSSHFETGDSKLRSSYHQKHLPKRAYQRAIEKNQLKIRFKPSFSKSSCMVIFSTQGSTK